MMSNYKHVHILYISYSSSNGLPIKWQSRLVLDRSVASWRSLALQVPKLELCDSYLQRVSSNHKSTSIANKKNVISMYSCRNSSSKSYWCIVKYIYSYQKKDWFPIFSVIGSTQTVRRPFSGFTPLQCPSISDFRPRERWKNLTKMSRVDGLSKLIQKMWIVKPFEVEMYVSWMHIFNRVISTID